MIMCYGRYLVGYRYILPHKLSITFSTCHLHLQAYSLFFYSLLVFGYSIILCVFRTNTLFVELIILEYTGQKFLAQWISTFADLLST